MNLAQAIDPVSWHCRADSPAAAIHLLAIQRSVASKYPPLARHGRRQAMSAPVLRALKWLRKQEEPVYSRQVRLGAGIDNYLIGSVFQRLIERGYVVRSGACGRFLYRAVR